MMHPRNRKLGALRAVVGLVALGAAADAWAQNLLINPGFESPAEPPAVNTNVAGWTLVNDAARAPFQQNHASHPTPASEFGIWAKTFQPAGGGIFQDVTGLTGGANYELKSIMFIEAGFLTITDPIEAIMRLTWLDAGGGQLPNPSELNITPASSPPVDTWAPFSLMATAPANAAGARVFFGWEDGGPGTGAQSVLFDNAELLGPGSPPLNSTWIINGSGDWNIPGNWANGVVPNAPGATAEFFGAISAPQTVFTNAPVTVGFLNFNNANAYVITGAGNMTLQVNAGTAGIQVAQGNHKINLPFRFASNANVNVSAGASLNFADPVTVGAGRIVDTTGNVSFNAPLTIESGGTLGIGANARMFGAPAIGTNARLNIRSNAVAFDYNPGASPLGTIRSQIISGFAGGAWNGTGIISTTSNNSTHGVGYAEASAIFSTFPATFQGMSVDADTVLVRRTRYGDANLDGLVNLQDFNRLAASFGTSGTGLWSQGDFNYDGNVNLQDFNRLAANFGQAAAGTEVTPQDWANLASAIPEPTSATFLFGMAASAAMRRRRR
jgi:hypothetical protein